MREICSNLYIGSDYDCSPAESSMLVIHACKTCHQRGVGYRGNLSQSHPNYLILENGNHLYLNLVDMEQELNSVYTHPIVKSALSFIEKNIGIRDVLIHCNQGQSRSPSIGMVYLARIGKITRTSYSEAKDEFSDIYPMYLPGLGIAQYLNIHWEDLINLEI